MTDLRAMAALGPVDPDEREALPRDDTAWEEGRAVALPNAGPDSSGDSDDVGEPLAVPAADGDEEQPQTSRNQQRAGL